MEVIRDRVIWGFSTIPTYADGLQGIILLLGYTAIALSIGFRSGFLKFEPHFSPAITIRIGLTSLIAPAILEELFFRVILLPHPTENLSYNQILLRSLVALFLFVIYHPLNGLTFFTAARKTFFDPIFLVLAGGLGLICTLAYLLSGSIWLSIIIHWLTVVIWLLYFAGINKLQILKSD